MHRQARAALLAVMAGSAIAMPRVAHGQAPAPVEPVALAPGVAAEAALAPDATLRFTVRLTAGAFVDVTIEQLGIDAIVALTGPDGAAIDEVDDRSELDGPEHVRLVAPAEGVYTLTIRSEVLPAVRAGRCRVTASTPRDATDADRALVAERTSAMARLATLQAEYDQLRKTGRHDAETDQRLIDGFAEVARAAAAAGRLRAENQAQGSGAYLLLILDRAPEVIRIVERRLAWLKGARYQAGRAVALTQLAEASTRVGNVDRAITLFQEALTLPQPPATEAITRDNLGGALRRVGRLQEALEAHHRALEYFRANGPRRSVAVVLTRLALAWQQLGDYQRKIALEREVLEIFTEVGDKLGTIRAQTNLATSLRDRHQLDEARKLVAGAREAAAAAKLPLYEGHASLVLANIELDAGRPAEAVAPAKRALELYRAAEYEVGLSVVLQALGQAQHQIGQLDDAAATLAEATAVARQVSAPGDEQRALHLASQVSRAQGRLTLAREQIEAALASVERQRADLGGTQLRSGLTAENHAIYEDHVSVLVALHQAQPGQGFDRLALQASELSRARSLLDVLALGAIDVRSGVDAALLAEERALRARLAEKDADRSRAADAKDADKVTALGREIDELTAALQLAESRIASSGPAFATLTRPRTIDVDQLRRDILAPDTVLLEYAVGDTATWLFALTPETLDVFRVPGRDVLTPAVRTVLDAMTARQQRQPPTDPAARERAVAARDRETAKALDALGQLVVGPIADRLAGEWRGKRLVFVPTGPLEYVPFAALPLPRADGGPAAAAGPSALVASHEVVIAPSGAAIAALRRETAGRRPAAKTLAIFADPVFETDDPRVARASTRRRAAPPQAPVLVATLAGPANTRDVPGRLPQTRREAMAIAALLPASERRIVTDFAASRRAVLDGGLADYRIVHFATHGLIDAAQPGLSSLALSLVDERGAPVDGYLRMQDIYNQRLPVDLVVLSACRTALGGEMRGEGLIGLTRGFMYAGARGVVASLWQVDDAATSALMTRFYRHLLVERLRPAAALRAAQRELAAEARWAAPYYWAGFVVQGDW
jgi:CHAT domain-containing protein/tetratricopeptide (TPR) repeat protein